MISTNSYEAVHHSNAAVRLEVAVFLLSGSGVWWSLLMEIFVVVWELLRVGGIVASC